MFEMATGDCTTSEMKAMLELAREAALKSNPGGEQHNAALLPAASAGLSPF